MRGRIDMREIAKMMEGQDLSIFGSLPALKSDAVVPVDLAAPARPALDPARLGKITVSCFDQIGYGKDGKSWTVGAMSLMFNLVAQHAAGKDISEFHGSAATDWGHQHEPAARAEYERRTGNTVRPNPFIKAPWAKLIGGTPDGVGAKGLEIKCPYSPAVHIRTVINGIVPKDHIAQVRGQALLTDLDIDFVSFDPRLVGGKNEHLAFFLCEYKREGKELEELKKMVLHFEADLLAILERLGIEPIF